MILSTKATCICQSSTLVIDAKAKKMKAEGIDVISFGAGEPDFDTPEHIKNAAIKAINEGFTKYTPASGTAELKRAVCEKLKKDNNLDYSASNIVISNGAKHSLANAFFAICNPGDEVIIPGPYWVSYPEMVKMADGIPVVVNAAEQDGFKVGIRQIEKAATNKTKAIVLNSPNNPTGMVYSPSELKEIADFAVSKKLFIISDEIYEKLIYDGCEHVSIASLDNMVKDYTIVINGVSKTYSMTGWRIGYSASNAKIAEVMANVQSHATSNPNSIAQKAAEAAIKSSKDIIENMVIAFNNRRDYMVKRINSIKGLSCIKPNGAFYVMMNISNYIGKEIDNTKISGSDDFADIALEKAKIALVPGSGFGIDTHVRLSYATSMENITEGLNRIEALVEKVVF